MKNKIAGAVYGMAIGDALGYPTEFMSMEEIEANYLPNQPIGKDYGMLQVTDDTQMAIAVAKMLAHFPNHNFEPKTVENLLRKYFIEWYHDPKNNRAPGMTCLQSCERLEKGLRWQEATSKSSKGCGANMRVVPLGLLAARGLNHSTIAKLAQFQSALTHAHPTALAAADLTTMSLVFLLEGCAPENLLNKLKEYALAQSRLYHKDYLKSIWNRPPFRTAEDFIEHGWQDCLAVLEKVEKALLLDQKEKDPCLLTGEGWIAEESLGTALLCFLYYPEDSNKVLRRAIMTSGDSDSIACLAGAFVGAHKGVEALHQPWVRNIEYGEELKAMIALG